MLTVAEARGIRQKFSLLKQQLMRERIADKKAFEVKRKQAIKAIEQEHKDDIIQNDADYYRELAEIRAAEAAELRAH